MRPLDHETIRPWDHKTMRPWDYDTMRPWDHATMRPWDHKTMWPWDHEAMRPWGHATMRPWDHETMRPWDHDAPIKRWPKCDSSTTKNRRTRCWLLTSMTYFIYCRPRYEYILRSYPITTYVTLTEERRRLSLISTNIRKTMKIVTAIGMLYTANAQCTLQFTENKIVMLFCKFYNNVQGIGIKSTL